MIKKYIYEFKYESSPGVETTINLKGMNPFDALTTYRAEHPTASLWPNRIISIIRIAEQA